MNQKRPTPNSQLSTLNHQQTMMTTHETEPNSERGAKTTRRQFCRRATTAIAAPLILPASVLGLNGAVAPSNRIVFGCIGVGARARHVMPSFLAQNGHRLHRRQRLPRRPAEVGEGTDGHALRQQGLPHVSGLPRVAGAEGHRRRVHRHGRPLAHDGVGLCGARRQGHLLRKADLDDHPRGARAGRGLPSPRHDLPGGHATALDRVVPVRGRDGPPGPPRPRAHRRDAGLDRADRAARQVRRPCRQAGTTTAGSARCSGGRSCRGASTARTGTTSGTPAKAPSSAWAATTPTRCNGRWTATTPVRWNSRANAPGPTRRSS